MPPVPDAALKALLRRSRAQIAIATVIVLAVVTLLLLPLRRADYALEADVRSLRFRMLAKEAVAVPLAVRWVVVQGHAGVHATAATGGKALALSAPVVRVAADEGGAIKLEFPQVPAGAQVEIGSLPEDDLVEVVLCGVDEPARIGIAGPVTLVGESTHALRPARPTSLLVLPRPAQAGAGGFGPCDAQPALRYRFQPVKAAGELELTSNLGIRDLELFSQALGQHGVLRPRSSIIGGGLRLASVGGKTRPLPRYEFLVLERNAGELRSLVLKAGVLGLMAEGSASGLYVGTQGSRSSIMPTLFEWVHSRDQIVLAWSTGLSALGLLLGLYAWLKGLK